MVCMPTALQTLLAQSPALMTRWHSLPRRAVERGTVLQRAQAPSTHCWLVEEGLLRIYYLQPNGVERNRSFHLAGSWVGGSLPPLPQTSPYTIEALEPGRVLALDYATLQEECARHPVLLGALQQAMGYLFQQQSQRESDLLSLSPQQRYLAFLSQQPALAQRLPQHHIASYLGISHVSLSRMRARLGLTAPVLPLSHQGPESEAPVC